MEKKTKKKYKRQYISNTTFVEELIKWKDKKKDNPNEPIPEYIGECFFKLTENIAHLPSFAGYSYLDEFKGHALLTCCLYAHNFDPEKSNNAFAYFTEIIKKAFIQMLNKEAKLSDAKFEMIKELCAAGSYDYNDYLNEEN